MGRHRIQAPPGLVHLVKTTTLLSKNANDVAGCIMSHAARCFVPATATMVESISKCRTFADCVDVLERTVKLDEKRRRALCGLLSCRRNTVYGMLCVSAVTDKDRIEEQLYEAFAARWKAEVRNAVKVPEGLKGQFRFDLRREAYCQRRFITDKALQDLATKNPEAVAWHLYADALDVRFKSRPPIFPVPHFYSAYYDFYMTCKTPHFYSENVLIEALSALRSAECEPYLKRHAESYALAREGWQLARFNVDDAPRYQFIDPSDYKVKRVFSKDGTRNRIQGLARELARKAQGGPDEKLKRMLALSQKMRNQDSNAKIAKNQDLFFKWQNSAE